MIRLTAEARRSQRDMFFCFLCDLCASAVRPLFERNQPGRRMELMTLREIRKLDTRIRAIRKASQELKELSDGIPAVNRNADRILASVKMLEINITDILPHLK